MIVVFVLARAGFEGSPVNHLVDPTHIHASADPERAWQRTQFSDEVLAALATLPDHYREAVRLVDIEGLPYKDASERIGCPLGTVMSRLHRARRLLREQLAEYAREAHGIGMAA